MKIKTKEELALAVSLVALCLILLFATLVTEPKRLDYGATWGMFLKEPAHSIDVMLYGSSLVYCDVAPAVLFEETGLTSYIMAGPEQTLPLTHRYLQQTLKTQSPQAVFVEITGLFYPRHTSYTKVNVGNMPMGIPRLLATFQEAEPNLRGGLLFPLSFYHDRWSQLTAQDVKLALGGYTPDPLAGYTFLSTFCKTDGPYLRSITLDKENYQRNLAALDKIKALCQKQDIELVLYVAPGLGRIGQMDEAVVDLSTDFTVLDCNAIYDELGIDEKTDYHDTLHFNYSGADKFSRWLSDWIQAQLNLSASPPKEPQLWLERMDRWAYYLETPLTPKETF